VPRGGNYAVAPPTLIVLHNVHDQRL